VNAFEVAGFVVLCLAFGGIACAYISETLDTIR